MIDKNDLQRIVEKFGEMSDGIPMDYCSDIWKLIKLANRVLNGELVEVISKEEIETD